MYQFPRSIFRNISCNQWWVFRNHIKKVMLACCFLPFTLHAQQRITIPEYVETYRYIAMWEMRESGIPASIKLAQAILESGFGNSELAVNANNHFGIKCHGWTGMTYYYDDDKPNECFRKYTDPVQSFLDHTEFLRTRGRYFFLFELEPTDYEAWAHGLRAAGYATNPRYPEQLIRLIQQHELHRYDKKALDPDFLIAEHQLRPSPPEEQTTDDPEVVDHDADREVRTFNRINYVLAREGDTMESLAEEMDMPRRRLIRYNDMQEGEQPDPGQRIYLQPKRRRGAERSHIAEEGETMADISNDYGIRMENLYRRNDMSYGMEPEAGQKIRLKGYEGSFFDYLLRRP